MTVPKLSMSINIVKNIANMGLFLDMAFRYYNSCKKICPVFRREYVFIKILVYCKENPLVGRLN